MLGSGNLYYALIALFPATTPPSDNENGSGESAIFEAKRNGEFDNFYYTTLLSKANNKYVSADSDEPEGSALVANRESADDWEMFQLFYDPKDGSVMLKAKANGLWVSTADPPKQWQNGGFLMANKEEPKRWEKFKMGWQEDGTVAFMAKANGKWVGMDESCAKLVANMDYVDDNAKFYLNGGLFTLSSLANGQFVSADTNVGPALTPLVANRRMASQWEWFRLVHNVEQESFSFLSVANSCYVSAAPNSKNKLFAKSNKIGKWEQFAIVGRRGCKNGSVVAIKAMANRKFVTIGTENAKLGTVLSADRTKASDWEMFKLLPALRIDQKRSDADQN